MLYQNRIVHTGEGNAKSVDTAFIQKRWRLERSHQRDFMVRRGGQEMKLIDYMVQQTGESEEYIMSIACPSSYGPEFDKYDRGCGRRGSCRECWEQEMEEG